MQNAEESGSMTTGEPNSMGFRTRVVVMACLIDVSLFMAYQNLNDCSRFGRSFG